DEQYRELDLNERFARYASAAGFAIRVCEGYDPESKGKVEAGVKYVKGDGLYGEDFEDWSALAAHLRDWLECVANVRVHGTTGEIPKLRFDSREQAALKPYLSPACLRAPHTEGVLRKVDKTGLLSFQGNRYSAPLAFQRGRVRVVATPDGQLRLHHADTGELVATHPLHPGKGALVKNGDHYRDKAKARAELEAELEAALGHELGQALCAQLRQRDRAYYLDKLRGARRYLPRLQRLPPALLQGLLARPGGLSIRQMSEYLDAFEAHPERALRLFSEPRDAAATKRTESTLLSAYRTLTGTEQESGHELH
ncbi:MAG: transposase, partial [Anaerolineales bacterium]|nr:transposase [Anaerolineales bacterium]